MRMVHRIYFYWNTYVLFVIDHSVKSFFKKEIELFLHLFCTWNENKSRLFWFALGLLFDQVLPNFFNRFECSLNIAKLFPKYLIMKFIFKSISLIFNEAMTTVSLNYCFQNSHVLSELSDLPINLAQEILRRQFPEISGLEDTSLGISRKSTSQEDEFIQTVHGNHHWLVVGGKKEENAVETWLLGRRINNKQDSP